MIQIGKINSSPIAQKILDMIDYFNISEDENNIICDDEIIFEIHMFLEGEKRYNPNLEWYIYTLKGISDEYTKCILNVCIEGHLFSVYIDCKFLDESE